MAFIDDKSDIISDEEAISKALQISEDYDVTVEVFLTAFEIIKDIPELTITTALEEALEKWIN